MSSFFQSFPLMLAMHSGKIYMPASFSLWSQLNFLFMHFTEPFCEERNNPALLSRSCDNVTQKLRQAERLVHEFYIWFLFNLYFNFVSKNSLRTFLLIYEIFALCFIYLEYSHYVYLISLDSFLYLFLYIQCVSKISMFVCVFAQQQKSGFQGQL